MDAFLCIYNLQSCQSTTVSAHLSLSRDIQHYSRLGDVKRCGRSCSNATCSRTACSTLDWIGLLTLHLGPRFLEGLINWELDECKRNLPHDRCTIAYIETTNASSTINI